MSPTSMYIYIPASAPGPFTAILRFSIVPPSDFRGAMPFPLWFEYDNWTSHHDTIPVMEMEGLYVIER